MGLAYAFSYIHVKKNGLLFTPLRACGLAVEKAHKAARDRGLGNVCENDVKHVLVSGDSLLALVNGRMRRVISCRLDVQPSEQKLALTLLREQRLLFSSLSLNLWFVDKAMGGGLGFHDLVGEFSTANNFGVRGLVTVELKVASARGLRKKWSDTKAAARTKLAKLQERGSSFETAMLVSCVEM